MLKVEGVLEVIQYIGQLTKIVEVNACVRF